MLSVGTKAPVFTLPNKEGTPIKLEDFRGSKVVLYFYPKDHTPGCTRQACAFRDTYDGFKREGITVIGISQDSTASHQDFADQYKLPFILLSDPEHIAIKAYDVWQQKTVNGQTGMGVVRSTYIIDEQGMIEKVYEQANPDTNAQDILDYLGEA